MECLILEPDVLVVVLGAFAFAMGGIDDCKRVPREMDVENLSLGISNSVNRFPRDLLQGFMGSSRDCETVEGEEHKGIELSLGLSLGGRFGVDKSSNTLVRSSSIASYLPVVRDDSVVAAVPSVHMGLVRTSSLPVEIEEEWRKRKELQSLRRMEAKRRRSEKQRSLKSDREIGSWEGGNSGLEVRREMEVDSSSKLELESSLAAAKGMGSSVRSQFGLPAWAAAVSQRGSDLALGEGEGKGSGNVSQELTESIGRSSSSASDLNSRTLQGSGGELSPASIQSSQQEAGSQDMGSSATRARKHKGKTPRSSNVEDTSKSAKASASQGREIRSNSIEDMPNVFTIGDGPNGRRVDGILYKYSKGEGVHIMCVCHGTFHSPSEFVKHAGGTNVHHPLKHIVINPNSSSLL